MTRRLPAAQRREQLVDICAQIVDLEGFTAATIERVAGEAGVSRTVVYQQFGGLDGMYDALVERATRRAAETLAEAGAWNAGTATDVMATVLAAADADPPTWRLFLVVAPNGPPSLTRALAAGRRRLREHVTAGIGRTDDDAASGLAARLLQAVADEVVRLRLADPSQYDHQRLLSKFDAVSHSLLRPASNRLP